MTQDEAIYRKREDFDIPTGTMILVETGCLEWANETTFIKFFEGQYSIPAINWELLALTGAISDR